MRAVYIFTFVAVRICKLSMSNPLRATSLSWHQQAWALTAYSTRFYITFWYILIEGRRTCVGVQSAIA